MTNPACRTSSMAPVSRAARVAQLEDAGTVRVLFVDDAELDCELIGRWLRKRLGAFGHDRVDSPQALRRLLSTRRYDLVLADWTVPGFAGFEALAIVRELAPEVPCLLVSGFVDDERAAAAIQAGARDLLSKDDPVGLVAAVERELALPRSP